MNKYYFTTYYGNSCIKNSEVTLSAKSLREAIRNFIDTEFKVGHQPYGMIIKMETWKGGGFKSLSSKLNKNIVDDISRDIKFKVPLGSLKSGCVSVKVWRIP